MHQSIFSFLALEYSIIYLFSYKWLVPIMNRYNMATYLYCLCIPTYLHTFNSVSFLAIEYSRDMFLLIYGVPIPSKIIKKWLSLIWIFKFEHFGTHMGKQNFLFFVKYGPSPNVFCSLPCQLMLVFCGIVLSHVNFQILNILEPPRAIRKFECVVSVMPKGEKHWGCLW